jgi:hypothetical protein
LETGNVLDHMLTDYQSRSENIDPSFSRDAYKESMFTEMDVDGRGFISVHEMKVFLTKKFVELNKEPASQEIA